MRRSKQKRHILRRQPNRSHKRLCRRHLHRSYKNLRNAIQQLRNFPYKFPLVQNEYLKQQEIRCMPYKNYYIFYEVVENAKMVETINVCATLTDILRITAFYQVIQGSVRQFREERVIRW